MMWPCLTRQADACSGCVQCLVCGTSLPHHLVRPSVLHGGRVSDMEVVDATWTTRSERQLCCTDPWAPLPRITSTTHSTQQTRVRRCPQKLSQPVIRVIWTHARTAASLLAPRIASPVQRDAHKATTQVERVHYAARPLGVRMQIQRSAATGVRTTAVLLASFRATASV